MALTQHGSRETAAIPKSEQDPHDRSGQVSRRRVHVVLAPSSSEPEGHDDARDAPIDGALARVYLRRNAGSASIAAVEQLLRDKAHGRYVFGRRGAWTTVEVTTQDDLLMIRREFPGLVDGWRELL